jgi:HAD superfamily hydrolase (TIGR01490 family)
VPRAAAFFDLDKTLIEGSSAIHFGRAAYRRGLVTKRRLALDLVANVRFRLRGSTDEETDALRQRILDSIAGHRVVDLARLGPEMLAGILPRAYPQMLDVAWRHQDEGLDVYIVTAASQELADTMARVFVLDGGIGMRSEVRDGVYTGRPEGPFTYREGKAEAIREVARRDGLDLAESWAYSDSASDLPMLRVVGHPVAVNPDRELLRVARESGWGVLRFDRLGRRLKVTLVLTGAAAAGALASAKVARRGRWALARRVPRAGVRAAAGWC